MSSTDRILTSHTGSLPRPPELLKDLDGHPATEAESQEALRKAVPGVVSMQVDAGIDIVGDGEQSKPSYSTYVVDRMSGFGGTSNPSAPPKDVVEFPEWAQSITGSRGALSAMPACIGDLSYDRPELVEQDIANLKSALSTHKGVEGFLTAASPGVIARFMENQHYATHEDYVQAVGAAMKIEYDAIHAAGFTLQIDCPDLASSRASVFADLSDAEWRKMITLNIEALNEATRDIPPEAMRMHLCWGNYEGPHNHDVPLAEILDIVFTARPSGISFEGANPRHEHEWTLFEEVEVPDGKYLMPGVINSLTSFIEHPELVAQRISRLAKLVGRERVVAGTDCGFATFAADTPVVVPTIVAAKLKSMSEGAAIASAELWSAAG